MIILPYMSGPRAKRDKAEKLFEKADELVGRTEERLDSARTELAQYQEDALDFVSYINGVDAPEIGQDLKTDQIGLRFYTKRVRVLERELEDYRQAKREAEEDWKKYNGEMRRTNVIVKVGSFLLNLMTRIQTNYKFNFNLSEAPATNQTLK